MAHTALTVTTTAAAGVTLPAAAAVDGTNGNSFVNTGREQIEITNGSGSPITITFTPGYVYSAGSGVTYPSSPVIRTLAAGATKAYGPFDKTFYNDPATGTVLIDWSSATTVTARVIALGTA